MSVPEIILLAVAGLFGGAANSIAGGGSLVVFPALMGTGLTPLQANVTNSVAQWPSYLGGVIGFRAELRGQRRRVAQVAGFAAAGSAVGCVLLLTLPQAAFDAIVPALVLAASAMLAIQPRIKRWAVRRAQSATSGEPAGSVAGAASGRRSLLALFGTVFLSSVYGGYFGGALGVILIAALSLVLPDDLKRINALKTSISLVVASVTTVAFALFAPLDWMGVAVVAPAALVGGLVGARVARRVREDVLRWVIVALGVAVGVYLIVRAVSG